MVAVCSGVVGLLTLEFRDRAADLVSRAVELRQSRPGEVDGVFDGVSVVLAGLLFSKTLSVRPTAIRPAANLNSIEIQNWGEPLDRPALTVDAISDVDSLWQVLGKSTGQLILQTSGTSGSAKSMTHSFRSLTASVRHATVADPGKNSFDKYRDHVWALTYPVVSFAGLQVLFQALANGNRLVPVYGLPWSQIVEQLKAERVTHLSATPTFIRTLAACPGSAFPDVQRVVVGGERWNNADQQRLAAVFPNALFRNIYASTEVGSFLQSDGEVFEVPADRQDRVRVVDGELWVRLDDYPGRGANDPHDDSHESHGSLVDADGYFHTGDQVEVLGRDPWRLKFVGRSSNVINVGGHKVDPEQVEAILEQMPEVQSALVYGRDNPVTGKLVAADLVLQPPKNEAEMGGNNSSRLPDSAGSVQNRDQVVTQIRTSLTKLLQRHQIPRIIRVVPEIPLTASGKKRRSQA